MSDRATLRVPVLPVRDIVLFPGIIVPLFVGRPRSLKALEDAMLKERKVLVLAQREMITDDPREEDLFRIGTLCQVLQMVRVPDGTTKALVEGMERAAVESFSTEKDYFEAFLSPVLESSGDLERIEALRRGVMEHFERYVALHPKIPNEVAMSVFSVEDPGQFADLVASHLLIKVPQKQSVLEVLCEEDRLALLLKILLEEIEILELEHDIHDRVRQEMERSHREYYLREQLRVIQDELGHGEGMSEVEEYRQTILGAQMPPDVEKRALKELDRFAKMPPMSAEATVVRTYIDWMAAMPWSHESRDRLDIGVAKQVLEEDHYGLEEVKERILEFLAVRKRARSRIKGQVLCFVGPPGVGKTSLGRSVARAMNRKFVNISLGGIRDEAEIRGHRRTYIGALPGRILQKLRSCGTKNPVLLLDEIDKIGADFRGDPAAALLEVLDPEQNATFSDHFLEVPFDLSKVLFLTTANVAHTIPRPLLDRMEVIQIPGYVAEEKHHIARRHLWPKVLEEHGLKESDVRLPDRIIQTVVSDYTREAGVRHLERQLAKVARKATRLLVEAKEKKEKISSPLQVTKGVLRQFLGAPLARDTRLPDEGSEGAAVGLAWTETGGDVLIIEAVIMKGKGAVTFTGNLGSIMQESAQTALGYLRSGASQYGLEKVSWDKTDVHVHVPEGAIPKDGPSAGITLAVAMLSALGRRKVRHDVAMTGEITLRGNVIPVGGIREKVLAAKRQGIFDIILPAANLADVEQLPAWIRKGLTLRYVHHLSEVVAVALGQSA